MKYGACDCGWYLPVNLRVTYPPLQVPSALSEVVTHIMSISGMEFACPACGEVWKSKETKMRTEIVPIGEKGDA